MSIIDWSDTDWGKGPNAIGEHLADKLLRGCNVHWTRSYQQVADRVNSHVQKVNRKLANEAFCMVAKHVAMAKCKGDVLCLFNVLWGSSSIFPVSHLKLPFTDKHITVVNTECDWSGAENWVQWWTTKRHLQMLAKLFSIMNPSDWDNAPRNTNGVDIGLTPLQRVEDTNLHSMLPCSPFM